MKRALIIFALLAALPGLAIAERPMPRTLVALIDARDESTPRMTHTHRFLEMPANYLGFDIHYYPVNQELPPLTGDIAGIVLWFNIGSEVPNPVAYLDWLEKAQGQGKKIIILENGGIGEEQLKDPVVLEKWNRVLSNLGLEKGKNWIPITYKSRIDRLDKSMVGFERELGPVLPAFTDTHAITGRAESHLRVFIESEEPLSYDLVVTGPGGGYVAENYAMYHLVEGEDAKLIQWIVNPFLFLSQALNEEHFPVPDTTTLNGRRIFYSHIDGDGWNNITEIVAYNQNKTLSAEVIKKEIFEPYGDFAFSVGLITAEADPDCFGVPDSERVAREIYALPNVEATSHTHSHPLYWHYFADYTPEKEKPLLERYPEPPALSLFDDRRKGQLSEEEWAHAKPAKRPRVAEAPLGRNDVTEAEALEEYHTPRSYACTPFSIEDEISGSVKRIEKLLPPGKKVTMVQWSGDTSPFEPMLKAAREAGLYNMNGGDSRFDRDYPSYSYVSPVGIQIGGERQIYSSNSNENTYTNLWTGPFFGFRNLQITLENTEHPRRVKPANVYFHMYSGQKEASLGALKENMNYAASQPFIPVRASTYAAIANGFYSAQVSKEQENSWLIRNRGHLQTLRLDDADKLTVDLAASHGVLGWRHVQGSLYVALDPAVKDVRLTVTPLPAETAFPYLVESSWIIESLIAEAQSLAFTSHGYGKGVMAWQMPHPGHYVVTATREGEPSAIFTQTFETKERGLLTFSMPSLSTGVPLTINIVRSSHV